MNDKKQANMKPREHSICRRKYKGLGQTPNSVFDAPENSVDPAGKGFVNRGWANSKVAVTGTACLGELLEGLIPRKYITLLPSDCVTLGT